MSEPERSDADRLRSAEITLATLRHTAERHLDPPAEQPRARGYQKAMRDVIAVLDSRWLPEGAPVHFSSES